MSTLGTLYGIGNDTNVTKCVVATYDFATHGGAVGAAQGLGVIIPKNAVVTRVLGASKVAFTSDGAATIAINIGATEVNSATAYNHADYSGVDIHYSTPVATTVDSVVNIDIAGAALTAGRYDIFIEYLQNTFAN